MMKEIVFICFDCQKKNIHSDNYGGEFIRFEFSSLTDAWEHLMETSKTIDGVHWMDAQIRDIEEE